MKTTNKVIMLHTKNVGNNGQLFLKKHLFWSSTSIKEGSNELNTIPQHLYILSDDEPKIGDAVYNWDTKRISTVIEIRKNGDVVVENRQFTDTSSINNFKKIIATTDISLNLPLIGEPFIEAYIKAYNEGKPITEVQLEWEDNGTEEWLGDDYNGEPIWFEKFECKLHSDGTVIIHQAKTYTTDEIDDMFEERFNYHNYCIQNGLAMNKEWSSKRTPYLSFMTWYNTIKKQ